MKDAKNSLILALSLIVLLQSLFLFYLLRSPSAVGRRRAVAEQPAKPVSKSRIRPSAPVAGKLQQPRLPAMAAPVPVRLPKEEGDAGKIVLVLDDWGYNLRHRDFITDNDYRVTLSILPFRTYSTAVAELARQHGKEAIVHMPMEPHNKENYGLEEHTLMTQMSRERVLDDLDAAFATVPFAKGLSNHMGSKATEDERLMSAVMAFLSSRHLFFFDSAVTPASVGRPLAAKYGVGFAQRQIFIDNLDDAGYIKAQMMRVAQRAHTSGVGIGIGHDRPTTIGVLKEMIPKLKEQGYAFVFLSDVVTTPGGQ